MGKRIVALLLSVSMCVNGESFVVFASEVSETGEAVITEEVKAEEKEKVTEIGEMAETEKTEKSEETEESDKPEEPEITAEEEAQITGQVNEMLRSAASPRAAGVTEEQLFMQAPSYLVCKEYDNIVSLCGDYAMEALDSVSDADTVCASYMQGLKEGADILWNKIWASCGLATDKFEEFEVTAAKELIQEYVKADTNLSKAAKKVDQQFSMIDRYYNLAEKTEQELFKSVIADNNPLWSAEKTNQEIDFLFENSDLIMKYTGEGIEFTTFIISLLELHRMDVQILDDLIIMNNNIKDTAMRDALTKVRYELTENPAVYFMETYLNDKAVGMLEGMVKDAVKNIVGGVTKYQVSGLAQFLGKTAASVLADTYGKFKPTVSDIMYSTLLYQYWTDTNMLVSHYQYQFRMGNGTEDDMRYYQAAINLNAACTKVLLAKAKNLVKKSNPRLYSKMNTWEQSLGSTVNYELYLNKCLDNANKAVASGQLTITADKVTIKDENGNVIDETHDSTESIKARFAAIQNQYRPNVGQRWTGNYNGTWQCFGFARIVFSRLFGCEMPLKYYGNAKYKYQSSENVTLVGQLAGSNVNETSAKNLLSQGKLGDIIQACGAAYGQHTMVFVSADDTGVTVYDCNAHLNSSEPDCVIHQWTINWNTWASWYGTGSSSSENGISLYRAANYAQIYGDGDGMFYDDSVNFVIENGVLVKYNGWQSMVEIPDTVKEIGDNAFYGNTSMMSVSIPDGVKRIGNYAFENCTSLLGVVIPDSVESIGYSAFSGCKNLFSAYLPVNEKFVTIENSTFYNTGLKAIEIPDSVEKIGCYAFENCKSAGKVRLSKRLESMEYGAFRNCILLSEIEIPKSLASTIGYWSGDEPIGIFQGCENLKTVKFEEGTTKITSYLFGNCDSLESIEIPETVTVIDRYAFAGCDGIKEIKIPDSVTEIGIGAFENCDYIEQIIMSDSVQSIGNDAFQNCVSLEKIILSNQLQNITSSMFYNCKKLTTINFPSTLKRINSSAFYGCESLPTAVLPTGLERIDGSAFYGCKLLSKVVVPDTVTYLGYNTFYGCEALNDVSLGSGIKKIDSNTFNGCVALTEIVIPYYVESIGDSAFVNCTKLAKVTIPRKTESIASNAFSYPKKMTIYGCSGSYAQEYASGKGIAFVAQDIPATSISISSTGKTVEKYDDFRLSVTIAPANFTDEVIWTSSNEDVATVTEDGYVETYEGGTTVITVKAGKVSASCKVTVTQMVEWVYFSGYSATLSAGQTKQLKWEVGPEDSTNKQVEFTSSNTAVATVSQSGLVTARKPGYAEITVRAKDGSGEYDTYDIEVDDTEIKVSSISLNKTATTLEKGKTVVLTAKVLPDYATNRGVSWTSSNTAVATVSSNGTVTAKNGGTATITATAKDGSGKQATCKVTVPYTITYKLNGGKNSSKNPKTYYNVQVSLKNPTRAKYEFKGWYTDSKCKHKITKIAKTAKKNYTLYAKWKKISVSAGKITSCKNVKGKKLQVKYKKLSGVKGYEISYCTSSKFKKSVTKKTTTKTTYTFSKLKKGTTYYVRVRAYKLDSAKKKYTENIPV